jgi:hypothetical protein
MTASAYVGYSPWSGDVPVIYFGPSPKTTIVFTANVKKSWTVYHAFRVSKADLKRYGDEFEEQLPEWAFLVTNGKDQISLMPNVGKAFLEWHTTATDTELSVEVSLADATRMSKDLWTLYESVGIAPPKKTKHGARIKPVGHALTYVATASTFRAATRA